MSCECGRNRLLTLRPKAKAALSVLFVLALFLVLIPAEPPVFSIPFRTPAVSRVFPSVEAAAIDFGRSYNPRSIVEGVELASVIHLVTRIELQVVIDGKHRRVIPHIRTLGYSYTVPVSGSSDSALPNFFGSRGTPVAMIHTHGAYDARHREGNDDFSFGLFRDTYWSDLFHLPFYLVTPEGYLRIHLPDFIGPSIITLADDLPFDPRHPNRIRYGGDSFW